MEFENELFISYKLDKQKLLDYGFILSSDTYTISLPLGVDNFHVDISINKDDMTGHIYDETFGDEYRLFRNSNIVGEFVGSIREAYRNVLLDIREHCYIKTMFIDEQANRIAQYIINKYDDKPEFPWKKFPQFAIFRNKDNKLWYAVFMQVKDNTLGDNISARSIVNIKPDEKSYQELVKKENIFPGWHMDKKSWLTISLSDYFDDEYIKSLIDLSYQKINGDKH